eukprot:2303636-Amphidinium_carterae.1
MEAPYTLVACELGVKSSQLTTLCTPYGVATTHCIRTSHTQHPIHPLMTQLCHFEVIQHEEEKRANSPRVPTGPQTERGGQQRPHVQARDQPGHHVPRERA